MAEFATKILEIPFWGKFANFHGFLAMSSLIFFGAAIVSYFQAVRDKNVFSLLKIILLGLFINMLILDIAGLTLYIPYRAEGGPRTFLKSYEETAWLHNIVFEHKEFLAFAPLLLIFGAFMVVKNLGSSFNDTQYKWLRRSVFASLVLSLLFVLTVAGEAVLVTKAAPI